MTWWEMLGIAVVLGLLVWLEGLSANNDLPDPDL